MKIRAIKIDVIKKDVYEVEIPKGLNGIYEQLDCELITLPVILENEDGLYIDDEGLLREPEDQYGAFMFSDYPSQPLFGHGLIIGCDDTGDQANALSTVENIKSKVTFLNIDNLKEIQEKLLSRGFEFYTL
jgi:hypothetical protein